MIQTDVDPDVDLIQIDRKLHEVQARFHRDKTQYLPSIPPVYGPISPIPSYDASQDETVYYGGKTYTAHWGLCTQINRFYDNIGTGIIIKMQISATIDGWRLGTYYGWVYWISPSPGFVYNNGLMYTGFNKNSLKMSEGAKSASFTPSPYFSGFDVLAKYGKTLSNLGDINLGSNCYSGSSKVREGCYIQSGRIQSSGAITGESGASKTKVNQDAGYFYRKSSAIANNSSTLLMTFPATSISGNYQGYSYGNFAINRQSGWDNTYYSSRPSSINGYNQFFVSFVR